MIAQGSREKAYVLSKSQKKASKKPCKSCSMKRKGGKKC